MQCYVLTVGTLAAQPLTIPAQPPHYTHVNRLYEDQKVFGN